ncbi:PepSY domain-containing protein [Limnohabitans sp. T6-5]|uniref:PepSY domain-containing protein n=1 Tax=Limnohabitans sp. T6-5 TaxID=1100724 RepID=UPI001E2C227F|nr:PepSY domain-containing protein [Limnohabitans sp. T6-5]
MKKQLTRHPTRLVATARRSSRALPVRWAACSLLAVFALAWQGGAAASDKGDHERALQAVQSGQVLPLAKVLALVEREHPGQVLEVALENEGPGWRYEIKLLQPDGRLTKLKVDARTGEILKRKTR